METEKLNGVSLKLRTNCRDIIKEYGYLEHRSTIQQCEHILEEWAITHVKELQEKKAAMGTDFFLGFKS